MQHQVNIIRARLVTVALLLIPAVAMQATDQVNWTIMDFLVAGAAIFSAGLAYEFVARRGPRSIYRCGMALALVSALLLVWANGAVGLIGSESDAFNALYGGVLLVGLCGAAIARLQSRGMARAMAAMASAHGLVGAIALLTGKHGGTLSGAFDIVGVTALFMIPILGAAWLFRKDDDRQRDAFS
jgi:hypothetical protein